VLYAELGLNGAEVTDLLRWDPDLRRLLLARARPDLIVLAYGTNEMGRGDLTLDAYREQAASVLRLLAEEGGAPLLVLAPPDRGARRRTTARRLAQQAPVIFEGLRLAARDAGAAFWDTRAAMGGPGSIAAWRRRGLAQRDLVHLTRPGYERLGDLLGDALLSAYFEYRAPLAAAWNPTPIRPSAP
jgi:lysophospholipase L1-like esterase